MKLAVACGGEGRKNDVEKIMNAPASPRHDLFHDQALWGLRPPTERELEMSRAVV